VDGERGETAVFGDRPAPVPLCPTQMSLGMP